MSKLRSKVLLLIVTALVVVAFLAAPRAVSPVHAAPALGTVCVVPLDSVITPPPGACGARGVTSATAPNSTGLTFTGPITSPPTQLIVGVFINGSDMYLGFDVTLKADSRVLTPADADLTGTVLTSSPSVGVKCIGGHQQSVSGTCQATDTLDTIHFSASQGNVITTNGLLFRAIWNITGTTTAGAPIAVHFQTGCGTTSVTPVCITMISGSGFTPTPESFLTSNFDNSNALTIPFVSVSAPVISFGTVFLGSNLVTETLTYTSHNGFADVVSLSTTSASFFVTNPTCSGSLNVTSITPVANGIVHVGLTISASQVGTCGVTVLGSYSLGALEGFATTSSLVVPTTVGANFVDFSLAPSPTLVKFLATGTGTSSIAAGSLNSFAGNVALSTTSTLNATTPFLKASFNPNPVSVPAALSAMSTGTFSAGVAGTTYTVTLRGSATLSGFTRIKSVTLTVVVQDFSIQVTGQTSLVFNTGGSGSTTFTVSSKPATINGFTGAITVSTVVNATGLTVSCPPSVTLTTAGGTSAAQTCSFSSSTGGFYLVTITGSAMASGVTVTHSVTVTVAVNDFTLTASPTTLTVVAGVSGTSTVTVASLGAFNQAVSLSASSSLACTLTPSSVTPPASGTGASTLSCNGLSGSYTVTVTGTSNGLPTRTSTVAFTVQDFTITASSRSISVDTGSSGTSTITVSAANGFTGTVTLTVIAPLGVTASLTPNSVTGSGSSTLAVSSSTAGTFNVNVTGSSGSLSHFVTITVTVTSPSSVFGLPATEFYAIVGIVVLIAAVSAGLFLRSRRAKPSQPGSGKPPS